MRLFFLLVFVPLCMSGFSQLNPYYKADSAMRNYNARIKSADDLYKIVNYIRTNFDADSLRLRASFIWVTDNIAYDVKAFQKEDVAAAQLSYVIKNKKAICSGYASLIKYFCDAFNIENEIIEGYGRTGKRGVVMNQAFLRSNHAWNSVKINGTWRLIDATWAAGGVDESDEDNLVYRKSFNEVYYFTPPEKLILNHLPVQKQFQLTNKSMDQRKFMRSPLYTSDFLADSIAAVLPDSSVIKSKIGDTIIFKLKTNNKSNHLYAFSENLKRAWYEGTANYANGWAEFRYPVSVNGFYNLYIGYIINNREKFTLLVYKLEVN